MENTAHTIDRIFSLQQTQAIKQRRSPVAARVKLLTALLNWIKDHQEDIRKAIHADFKKPYTEIDISEIFVVTSEINHTLKHLSSWMKPKKVPTPLTMLGSKSYVQLEPKGVCLIIAPWNYPFNLALGPLVSALAAGNTAIIKPSEMTPHTSALIRRLCAEVFDENVVAVIEGEVEVAQRLLQKPFDHIFFTGSPMVGKLIMKAAAEHLTSVTLELGGKSPAVIDQRVDLKDAASKLVWGKFVNCGQTCIAPDYLLVQTSVKKQLVEAIKTSLEDMYNPSAKGVQASPDYARIVNTKHLQRLSQLLQDAVSKGAVVEYGGTIDVSENYFEPTLISHVTQDMAIMQEEIFGPLLPLMEYQEIDEAIDYINANPKPLALYTFSNSDSFNRNVIASTSSGGAVANDCVLHFLQTELPFGGVNNSGIGKAHGYYGFLAFSNEKAVMEQRIGLTASKPLYPPYGAMAKKVVASLLKWF
ncbi:aldehyde dehydrogenase family protein [Mongoliitalea daihaiensis]|uniref:aldehyde dehydrogenase family protein n=1 Tax=Mongoliitalea daihaiensis TaxID=2782006 RepID=UPI001F31063B|nr:aldehyde dehydrogenase family protein [Mongoliitalea daihaiensis]UJP65740.1 aldehyde dehydrogenase family protein [Mongoliitalea daihaiensis]